MKGAYHMNLFDKLYYGDFFPCTSSPSSEEYIKKRDLMEGHEHIILPVHFNEDELTKIFTYGDIIKEVMQLEASYAFSQGMSYGLLLMIQASHLMLAQFENS